MDKQQLAKDIAEKIRENNYDSIIGQVLMLSEEVGEFVGAYRRWAGLARRGGSFDDVCKELADVVIGAYCVAEFLAIDLEVEVEAKAKIIFGRPWKEETVGGAG